MDSIYASDVNKDYQELIKMISFELVDSDKMINNYYNGVFFFRNIWLFHTWHLILEMCVLLSLKRGEEH